MPVREPIKDGEWFAGPCLALSEGGGRYIYICKYAILESSSTTTPAKRVALRSSLGEVQLRAWSRSLSSRQLYVGSEPDALSDNTPFALSYGRKIAHPRNIVWARLEATTRGQHTGAAPSSQWTLADVVVVEEFR